MVPSGLAFTAAGMLTPLVVRRVRHGYVMGGGLALGAIGFALLAQVDEATGIGLVVAAMLVFSVGVTPVITLATELIVGSAPPERSGAASGISETGAEFGGAVGIAVLGSIGIAVYRGRLEDDVPAAVPPEQAETARDTLGGATEVAAQLPEAVGAALLDAAQSAFAAGFQVTAVTGAVVLAGLAAATAVLLRNAPPPAESVPEAVAAES
jgi:DHA2 family multidrug resistance protein-like MFS transporter